MGQFFHVSLVTSRVPVLSSCVIKLKRGKSRHAEVHRVIEIYFHTDEFRFLLSPRDHPQTHRCQQKDAQDSIYMIYWKMTERCVSLWCLIVRLCRSMFFVLLIVEFYSEVSFTTKLNILVMLSGRKHAGVCGVLMLEWIQSLGLKSNGWTCPNMVKHCSMEWDQWRISLIPLLGNLHHHPRHQCINTAAWQCTTTSDDPRWKARNCFLFSHLEHKQINRSGYKEPQKWFNSTVFDEFFLLQMLSVGSFTDGQCSFIPHI